MAGSSYVVVGAARVQAVRQQHPRSHRGTGQTYQPGRTTTSIGSRTESPTTGDGRFGCSSIRAVCDADIGCGVKTLRCASVISLEGVCQSETGSTFQVGTLDENPVVETAQLAPTVEYGAASTAGSAVMRSSGSLTAASACCPPRCRSDGRAGRSDPDSVRPSGAEGGNRTHTPFRAPDFESGASASSATSARAPWYEQSWRFVGSARPRSCRAEACAWAQRVAKEGARGGTMGSPA